jgi:exodeoxyribonuclease III
MSKAIKLLSWNVNGIRGAQKKGFLDWLLAESPDILCLQETKADHETLSKELLEPNGYTSYWHSAQRKGYSGVAVYAKERPVAVGKNLGIDRFDFEGRFIRLDFPEFILFNVYFPNGKMGPERLKFKLDFYDHFIEMLQGLRKDNPRLIFAGDVNTAHNEIDLARPKANSKVSGFLPVERKWMDYIVSLGYVDTFRKLHPDAVQYSWWDLKTGARQRNVGWRIDYVFVTPEIFGIVDKAYIMADVMGSDHCPVGVDLILE